jgi:Phosphotransferase enzyme family
MNESLVLATLQRAGWGDDIRLEPLGVTGNNHVLLAQAADRTFLVKQYFQHPDDPRNRFETERAFYTFLWDANFRSVPEPIAWYPEERLALLEFVRGEKPTAARPELVEEALGFLIDINRRRDASSANSLPLASEACFSVAEHLATVDRRIERLRKILPESSRHEAAIAFVRERLAPAWMALRRETERAMPEKDRTLAQSERWISPSDFGFHNTIRSADGRLRFFDFEYAGWDDPAKTVCDFFCQPAVPVPNEWLRTVLDKLRGAFGGDDLAARVALLLPVYQTKWCCIMLNDFLPAGNQRRVFSNPAVRDESRWDKQLEKAVEFHETAFP